MTNLGGEKAHFLSKGSFKYLGYLSCKILTLKLKWDQAYSGTYSLVGTPSFSSLRIQYMLRSISRSIYANLQTPVRSWWPALEIQIWQDCSNCGQSWEQNFIIWLSITMLYLIVSTYSIWWYSLRENKFVRKNGVLLYYCF